MKSKPHKYLHVVELFRRQSFQAIRIPAELLVFLAVPSRSILLLDDQLEEHRLPAPQTKRIVEAEPIRPRMESLMSMDVVRLLEVRIEHSAFGFAQLEADVQVSVSAVDNLFLAKHISVNSNYILYGRFLQLMDFT